MVYCWVDPQKWVWVGKNSDGLVQATRLDKPLKSMAKLPEGLKYPTISTKGAMRSAFQGY